MSAPANDLKKLTVQQLKALCKERRISGYSKLTKAALICKLTEASGLASSISTAEHVPELVRLGQPRGPFVTRLDSSPSQNANHIHLQPELDENSVHATTSTAHNDNLTLGRREAGNPEHVAQPGSSVSTPLQTALSHLSTDPSTKTRGTQLQNRPRKKKGIDSTPSFQVFDDSASGAGPPSVFKVPALPRKVFTGLPTSSIAVSSASTSGSKRLSSEVFSEDTDSVPSKKAKSVALRRVIPNKSTLSGADSTVVSAVRLGDKPETSISVNGTASKRTHDNARLARVPVPVSPPAEKTGVTPARFKPLILNKPNQTCTMSSSTSLRSLGMKVSTQTTNTYHSVLLSCLDFQPSPAITLVPIARPPSLSQRKRIPCWAIICSHLSLRDLAVCVQVSRTLRYAVYLSAVYRLKRNFSGLRLAYILEQYPQGMTDMWPYLRLREHELHKRRQAYGESFLPNYFQGSNPISSRLWTSPDHSKQIVVAIRFVLTRLWFSLSFDHDQQDFRSWQVTDAQELAKDEIWSISCQSSSLTTKTFYVLESTCEVIGQPPAPSHLATTVHHIHPCLPVRVDWSEYISQRLLPRSSHNSPPPVLLQHLKWTNYEEYDKGISKHWLKRIASGGEVEVVKRVVAERYVLACVVGNSISGRWMTTQQMAQEFAGLPSQLPLVDRKSPMVNLFLPPHHHVESVHFTTAHGIPLHAALAVVQTPGREYYILKDNGMTVGCEEDGVGEVWQQLLRCNGSGVPDD